MYHLAGPMPFVVICLWGLKVTCIKSTVQFTGSGSTRPFRTAHTGCLPVLCYVISLCKSSYVFVENDNLFNSKDADNTTQVQNQYFSPPIYC
jgi:hypothetical protein